MLAAAGVVVLGGAWVLITGFLAARQESQLQSRLQQVKLLVARGQVHQAELLAAGIPAMAQRAHNLTTGPAWWITAHIPFFGAPADATRRATAVADRIGSVAVPKLVALSKTINPEALRASGSTVRIAPLIAAQRTLQDVADLMDSADRDITAVPSTWLRPVDDRLQGLARQLRSIRGYVDAAARASHLLPTMLGADGPKRYFIGLQNEAEMRGTGGLPGAFTIGVANHGTISFTKFYSDTKMLPDQTHGLVSTGLNFGPDYQTAYGGSDPTFSYLNSNVSPDFPYTAQIWAAMWKRVSGEQVDGVLALDPTVLGYFLQAVGPAQVPTGQVITGENVISLTQRDQYAIFPNNDERKNFVVSVLKATANKLISGSGSGYAIVRATSLSGAEQRLFAWSRDPAVERLLEQVHYTGAIPRSSAPLSALILNNASSGKLDFYLDRRLTYVRTGCGASRDVVSTVTLTNNAPASGLPQYVTTRVDRAPPGAKPGDSRMIVDYYATDGALLQAITRNGEPSTAIVGRASGHPFFRVDLELPVGQTQTLVFHLKEPAGIGPPVIWRQPGVNPLALNVLNQSC